MEFANILIVFISLYLIYEISYQIFYFYNYHIEIIGPMFAVIIAYFTSTAFHFISERKQNTVIKSMFSHYVSGALVNELISNPDMLSLGGNKKNLTILFCDIAGFTTFSEKG